MNESSLFIDRVAVVTGGGSGIGRAAARRFASLGATVAIVDIDPSSEGAAAEIRNEGGVAILVIADVTVSPGAERLARECATLFGHIDILVNCVGGLSQRFATWDLPEEEWDRVVDLNLKSVFLCCKAVVPLMRARHYGRIVNISSGSGRTITHLTSSHYAAANSGILGFSRHLAREVAADGITVNVVVPGATLTPNIERHYDAARKREIEALVPMGRLSTPEDQAGPIVFLASDAARYITGATLDVNGGRYMI